MSDTFKTVKTSLVFQKQYIMVTMKVLSIIILNLSKESDPHIKNKNDSKTFEVDQIVRKQLQNKIISYRSYQRKSINNG